MAKSDSFPYTLLPSDKSIVFPKGGKGLPQIHIALQCVSKGLTLQSQVSLPLAEVRFRGLGEGPGAKGSNK